MNGWVEATSLSDASRVFIPDNYGTATYWGPIMSTASMSDPSIPRGPRKNYGAWKCRYCAMINDHVDLNCIHCGAPGEV
jgi:hypothetical protein